MRYSTVVKVVKIAGTVLTVAGTLASGWAEDKQAKITLGKLVRDQFKKKH